MSEDKNNPPDIDSNTDHPADNTLGNTINKLEGLLADVNKKKESLSEPADNIPVLNDVVDPHHPEKSESNTPYSGKARYNQHYEEHLSLLMDDVEYKIAEELDSVVEILKSTIKDSIINELKTQIELKENAGVTNLKPAKK